MMMDFFNERVPKEMKAILKTLMQEERANEELIDWLITIYADNQTLSSELYTVKEMLNRFLPPNKLKKADHE